MTTHHNAAVWLDHHEARLIFVDADNADELTLRTPGHTVHRHPKDAPAAERDHPDDAHHFFRTLAHQLERAQRVLVVGPASAKLQFLRFLQKNDPVLASRVVGIETIDHPTDKQLIAHAKQYFGIQAPTIGLPPAASAPR